MIAVQSPDARCGPRFRARSQSEPDVQNAASSQPVFACQPYGDSIMLENPARIGGVALASPMSKSWRSLADWARHEGIFLRPRELPQPLV